MIFKMFDKKIKSQGELEEAIRRYGFLPFFRNPVRGFSIQEMVHPALWFSSDEDGPWEWKGPILRNLETAYGKFFAGKAGYVSLEWFDDFANYRRAAYPVSTAVIDPIFDLSEASVYSTIKENISVMSRELKEMCGLMPSRKRKAGDLVDLSPMASVPVSKSRSGLERILNRLQMGTHVVIEDFEYLISKHGDRYGWGLARYSTPENLYAHPDRVAATPGESKEKIIRHLQSLLPSATSAQLSKIIS